MKNNSRKKQSQGIDALKQHIRTLEKEKKELTSAYKTLSHNIQERYKELQCLYDLSQLVQKKKTLEDIFQHIPALIRKSWQYPEITCVCLKIGKKEYKTENFRRSKYSQSAPVKIHGKNKGSLEIYYRKKMPEEYEGPFLKEERSLLNAFTENLGHIIERITTKNRLQKLNQQLDAQNQQLTATEQQLRTTNQQLDAQNQQLKATEQQLRTSNQQLDAQNQQLTATEQQLRTSNQQLDAQNQQLITLGEELRNERNLAQKYLDVASVMFVILDNKGRVQLLNKKACEILGYKNKEELIGKSWFSNCLPQRIRKDVKKIFSQLMEGKIENVEYIEGLVLCADGTERIIAWHNTVFHDEYGQISGTIGSGEDVTFKKQAEQELKKIEWLLEKEKTSKLISKSDYVPFYGDVTKLNTERTILDNVGKETLKMLTEDIMDLLDTSIAVYEKNGDYAFGVFESGWCQLMDSASRKLCKIKDNKTALTCGKWLCHENCWNDSAKKAIKTGKSMDIDCVGGIKLYAEPIYAGDDIIGVINIGYGNPPTDEKRLKELAEKFDIDYEILLSRANEYKSRPAYIIEVAKKRLFSTALLIGKIVENAQKEKTILEREQLLSFAINQIPVPIIIASAPDVTITHHNQAVEDMLVKMPDDMSKLPLHAHREFWPTFYPDGAPYDVDDLPLTRAIKRGDISRDLEIIVRRDDGDRWISANAAPLRNELGEIIAGIVAFPDITKRKQIEEELRKNEELLNETADMSRTGGWEIDIETKNVYWTKTTKKIHEVPEDYIPTLDEAINFFAPEARPVLTEAIRKALEEGIPYDLEIPFITAKGNRLWTHTIGNPEFRDGKCVRMHGIFQDITRRKEAEEEQEKLQKQLLQSQKMESVGRLAGGVAHDFNNMLSVILGHAELALLEDLTPDLHNGIKEIRNAAKRSADLTRQLLAFARRQTAVPKIIDLNKTVKNTLDMLEHLIGENIELELKTDETLEQIRMDPSQIDQILTNLIVNARDAIEGFGKIMIETRFIEFDAEFCSENTDFLPGRYIMIAVSDDGKGIDEEIKSNIFEPFFTTKKVGEGTGLGLSTVYGIIKQNQGFVNVYSELNEGTTFKIYLPVHETDKKTAQKTVDMDSAAHGNETVLFVEDEPSVLSLGTQILKKLGYRILTTSSPEEAIKLAEKHSGEIDLLITDVIMPEINGRDLANRLTSLYPHLKYLFVSGYTADVIAKHGVLDENMHFLEKPFSTEQLSRKVREALEN